MSSTYSGATTTFGSSITIPSDGDGPGIKAADVNVAFQALADRTSYLNEHKIRALVGAKTANGATAVGTTPTVVCGTNCLVKTGDLILINWSLFAKTSGDNSINVELRLDQNTVDVGADSFTPGAGVDLFGFSRTLVFQATADNVALEAYIKLSSSSGSINVYGPSTAVTMLHWRP